MKLFEALGLDIKIFIAQLINFAILFFVLYRYGYKPIFEFLEKRKNYISEGVKNAEFAQKGLIELAEKEKEVLKKAMIESNRIIKEGEELAKKNREEILNTAKKDVEKMKVSEIKKIEAERDQMMKKATSEIAEVVILATEKILGEKVNKESDMILIDKVIGEVTSKYAI